MKNTKLLFEMLLVGLIFVTCLFKSRERVCAGELQVECVLHKMKYVTYVSMILIVHYVHIQRDYLMAEKNVNQMRKSIAIYVVRI